MLLITCPFGLSSILWKELKIFWYNSQDTFSTWTFVDVWISWIYEINLRSRIANKVYLQLWKSENIKTFDQLFDLIYSLDYSKYFQSWQKISISASSQNSQLTSIPSIQSISQKAIIKKTSHSDTAVLQVEESRYKNNILDSSLRSEWQANFEIFIFLQNNTCLVFLNTSWISLHNRWYRKNTVEAPIKENVAAWLILLSWRKFKENFYDPFCWSWTICIEAAMIAKNIPPWINRKFVFQSFPNFEETLFEKIKSNATSKIFKDKKYNIYWSDIDPQAINIAQQNALNTWVDDTIIFTQQDFLSISNLSWHLLSNPPYGNRLQEFDLNQIYSHIDKLFSNSDLTWWIITSYEWFSSLVKNHYNTKSIFNWADKCNFYTKKT